MLAHAHIELNPLNPHQIPHLSLLIKRRLENHQLAILPTEPKSKPGAPKPQGRIIQQGD